MNENDLISQIRRRAECSDTRRDHPGAAGELAAPASPELLDSAERTLGFSLHPFHRRLLAEVANGGFGPGLGLIGLPGGALDAHGRSILELRDIAAEPGRTPPPYVVALCDWGDGIWSYLDSRAGSVLTLGEDGLKKVGLDFLAWWEAWIAGVKLWEQIVSIEDRSVIDPFSKARKTVQLVTGTIGEPYKP